MVKLVSSWPTTVSPPAPDPAILETDCGAAVTRQCQDQHNDAVSDATGTPARPGPLPLEPGGAVSTTIVPPPE